MSAKTEGERDLIIMTTRDGGYLVRQSVQEGLFSAILFAGHLDDCLAYIRSAIQKHIPSAGCSATEESA